MLELFIAALWIGLFSAGATTVLRVLPGIAQLTEKGVKPFVCDKCMSFWTCAIIALGVPRLPSSWTGLELHPGTFLLAGFGGFAVALLMLRRLTDPTGSFQLPELHDVAEPKNTETSP